MIYIFSTVCWFVITIIVHIMLHKVRLYIGISPIKIAAIFVLGVIGCSITNLWYLPQSAHQISLPLTSVLLYVSLLCAYATLTASPILGDVSPTTTLLMTLYTKHRLTHQEILALFSHEKVFGKRIKALFEFKFVEKKNSVLVLTKRGRRYAQLFGIYRKVLKISQGG